MQVPLALVLFDTSLSRQQLYPFSLTRSLADMFMGTCTIAQRWARLSGLPVFRLSVDALTDELPHAHAYLCVDVRVMPTPALVQALQQLPVPAVATDPQGMVAFTTSQPPNYQQLPVFGATEVSVPEASRIMHPMHIFQRQQQTLLEDIAAFAPPAATLPAGTNTVLGHSLHLGKGVQMEACIINTTEGPVWIDDGALVMEGTCIRGPVYIGRHSGVKMGTRLYGGTSIGQQCTVGGEVKNSVLMPYSNKAHDGYLGDSVIGSWCNLGAGTSNSNVKNTAGEVQVWHYALRQMVLAGTKCGVLMGDYSRTAVNTRIGTGTTIGICCSLHDDAVPPVHVPSFSWGLGQHYQMHKALQHIANWMRWKGQELTEAQKRVLQLAHDADAPKFEA